MKRLLSFILLLSVFANCHSQDLVGKWYMVNRSGLVEFEITEDSLIKRKLFTNLEPKQTQVDRNSYIKVERLDDKMLLIVNANTDTTKYSAMTIINFEKGKWFQLVWNTLDTITNNIEDLNFIHQQDKRQLYGYYVFSEEYLDSLKAMKEIDNITLEDFKKYAAVYVDKIKLTEDEFNKYNIGYAAVTYNFQLISQSLLNIGYNPLQNTSTIEPVYQKYLDHPEVKVIFEKIKEK